jgi:hypothetical protein
MAELIGLAGVKQAIRSLGKGKEKPVEHTVEYVAPYAIYVHENLLAGHPNGGQAKFLEQPARELRSIIPRKMKEWMQQGYTLEQASFFAASLLKDTSQPLVPVDTGRLKRSWRIRRVK